MKITTELWQAEINGQIRKMNLDELKNSIIEGTLLPQHKVKCGNLLWIEAQKVPAFTNYFESNKAKYYSHSNKSSPPPTSVPTPPPKPASLPKSQIKPTFIRKSPIQPSSIPIFQPQVLIPEAIPNVLHPPDQVQPRDGQAFWVGKSINTNVLSKDIECCLTHHGIPASSYCSYCQYHFCDDCPKTFGGKPNCCPVCSMVCIPVDLKDGDFLRQQMNSQKPGNKSQIQTKSHSPYPGQNAAMRKTNSFRGLLSIFLFVLILSSGGAYFWAYQFQPPNEAVENSMRELAVLDEKLSTNKIGLSIKFAAKEEQEKGTNQQAEDTANSNETLSQAIANLQQRYEFERKTTIENYRKNRAFDIFARTFLVLFAGLLVLIAGLRKLIS